METEKETKKPNGSGLKRLIRATSCSWLGLRAAWRHEQAFRQELLICLVMIPTGLLLGENGLAKALLVASILLLLIVELLNSAIEAVVDRIGTEHHPLSGRAKDLGSAAVFITLLLIAVVWLLVLFA